MQTVSQTIAKLLQSQLQTANNPDILERYHLGMETQVNVLEGKPVEGKRNTFERDGFEVYPIRIPRDADTNEPHWRDYPQRWPLSEHAESIGMTGWDWANRKSRWVAFDFDAITEHGTAGVSDEQLEAVREAAFAIPYVQVRKSTRGGGFHLYVYFAGDGLPCENHTIHADLARCVLAKMSEAAKFDFAQAVDTCGGNMWVWHREQSPDGYALVKQNTSVLSADNLPSDWREQTTPVQREAVESKAVESELTAWQQRLFDACRSLESFHRHGPNTYNVHKQSLATAWKPLGVDLPTNSGNTDPGNPNGSVRFLDNGNIGVYSFGKEPAWKPNGETGSYIIIEPPIPDETAGGMPDEPKPKTKAERILSVAERDKHFHSGKTPVVDFTWQNKRYVLKLPSDEYIRLLMVRVKAEYGKLVTERDVRNVLPFVVQRCFDGPSRNVFTRVGYHAGKIYIDLADSSHRAIEIDTSGWRIVDEPPIIFTRSDLITPLPQPVRGGSLHELKPFLNLSNDDFAVAASYLIGCWNPFGPFPSLAFVGPAGIAKSTSVRFLQAVVDPSSTPNGKQRACHSPSNAEDVLVHATHRWFIFLDNLSTMSDKLSDLCCLFATGGGTIKRKLYSDSDFAELSVEQPLVLAMVNDLIAKEDLRSRTLFIFPPMLEGYRPEREMLAEFDGVLPRIVGALADAVSASLANRDTVAGCEKLRFADFVKWVIAAEPATDFEPGTFKHVLQANRRQSAEQVIDTPLGNAIRDLADEGVKLLPSDLLQQLRTAGVEDVQSPVWLSRRLHELTGEFAQCGVLVRKSGKRWQIETAT